MKWRKQPFYYDHPIYDKELKKPANFGKMRKIAQILCKGFPFVCVDLYLLNDGSIKFGEMTFTRSSGAGRWNNEKYNLMLGKLIKLPENAYDVLTDTYTKLPDNYHKEIFSALHPEISVPIKPQQHVISYKLFNSIPIFGSIQCGGRQVWKVFGLPLWKIRRFENNITTKYYICGIPFIKVSKK
ncbi:MAG: hypothetical protein IJS88_01365 [Alphaproteobacteria bacterium]|nr:hypothetical protein [Alphaproteobacteria bacterium]